MHIREDPWLSAIFGYSVFRIDIEPLNSGRNAEPPDTRSLINRHASQQPTAMYYAKVDTGQVEWVRLLSSAGLYVVDVNVTFEIDPRALSVPDTRAEASRYSIGEIGPDQHPRVLDIAASSFRYSRFHLDPLVPDAIANRVKHDWILNYIRKQRGERLLVASVGEQPVGFLAVLASESDGKQVRTIDLMGVREASQKQGVGQALVTYFIDQYKEHCDSLQVGTQAANVPSMRLYEKLGFSIIKTAYVMHMHVRGGEPAA